MYIFKKSLRTTELAYMLSLNFPYCTVRLFSSNFVNSAISSFPLTHAELLHISNHVLSGISVTCNSGNLLSYKYPKNSHNYWISLCSAYEEDIPVCVPHENIAVLKKVTYRLPSLKTGMVWGP